LCCAQGATCNQGRCELGDLEILANDVLDEDFVQVDVAAGACDILEGCVREPGARSLVSIRATVTNSGVNPVVLGEPWESSLFHASLCEQAYVMKRFIRAEVLDDQDEVVAVGNLPTSCVADSTGDFDCTLQGLEPNGQSAQPFGACDQLDITGLAAGSYQLRLTVNPDQLLGESDFENNSVTVALVKPDCDGRMCGGVCCPSEIECRDNLCLLPDLRVNELAISSTLSLSHQTFGEDSCEIAEMCVGGSGRRRLLQFEGRIENWGPGDVNPGAEANNPLFEFSSCHGHYHFLDFTDYKLLKQDGTVAAQGHKQSFCLVSMDPVEGATIPAPNGTHPEPGPTGCNFLQAGYADIYGLGTPCQWVDVTDVPEGDYVLQVAVNPIGRLLETTIANNVVSMPIHIPADVPCTGQLEICGDDIDQDCDDTPDEYDSDCYGGWQTVSGNETCDTATELTQAGLFQANLTVDNTSDVTPSCGGAGGDFFFAFTLDEPEVIFASTEESTVDTVLAVYSAGCADPALYCEDDSCGEAAHFAALLDAGSYVLAVKAKESDATGGVRLRFQKTGVHEGALVESPGLYEGDTSSSDDNTLLDCQLVGPPECCSFSNPCNWANDGWCDCGGTQPWDYADCGGGGGGGVGGAGGTGGSSSGGSSSVVAVNAVIAVDASAAGDASVLDAGGASGDGGIPAAGAPDDIRFIPLCAGAAVFASTCGLASFDSAIGIGFGALPDTPGSCVASNGDTNQCTADPNGATVEASGYEPAVAFVVVDGETAQSSGVYSLYLSY
jgi:hypothetical protein